MCVIGTEQQLSFYGMIIFVSYIVTYWFRICAVFVVVVDEFAAILLILNRLYGVLILKHTFL